MALSDKQEKFVLEYIKDLNATAAYKRAGYKCVGRAAENAASRMLGNVGVQAAIQKRLAEQKQDAKIDALRVLREYISVGLADIGDIMDFSGPEPKLKPANEIPEHARRAISSMKVKRYWEGSGEWAKEVEVVEFRLWPKLDALREVAARVEPTNPVIKIDVTSGGKTIEQRDFVRAEAIAEAMRLVGLARPDISGNGSGKSVDTPHPALAARGVPSTNGHH